MITGLAIAKPSTTGEFALSLKQWQRSRVVQVHVRDQQGQVRVLKVSVKISVKNDLLLAEGTPAMGVIFLASGRITLVANGVEVVQKLALEVGMFEVRAAKDARDVKSGNADTFDLFIVGFVAGSFTMSMATLALTIVRPFLPFHATDADASTAVRVGITTSKAIATSMAALNIIRRLIRRVVVLVCDDNRPVRIAEDPSSKLHEENR
jgi:hypothetical protein